MNKSTEAAGAGVEVMLSQVEAVLSINLPCQISSNDGRERDDIKKKEMHLINILLL